MEQTPDTGRIIEPLSEGDKFPETTFKTIDGELLKTKDLKGKVVFYNFYFAACPPCIAQKGGINELYKRFQANDDVVFISVTFDNDATIKQFREKYGIRFKIVFNQYFGRYRWKNSIDKGRCNLRCNNGYSLNFHLPYKMNYNKLKPGKWVINPKRRQKRQTYD